MLSAPATTTSPIHPYVSPVRETSQNETVPSDTEILMRVQAIRSQWTVAERLRRRREADKRFSDLLEALCIDHAA